MKGSLSMKMRYRLLISGVAGILLCGWSTGFFFAVVRGLERTVEQAPDSREGR